MTKPTVLEALREMRTETEKFILGDDKGLVYCRWPEEICELLIRELTIATLTNPLETQTILRNILIMMFHLGITTERNNWEWLE